MALPRHARLASWWIEGLRFLSAYVVLGDAMADTNNVQKCTCNDSGLIRYFANKWRNLCAKITVDLNMHVYQIATVIVATSRIAAAANNLRGPTGTMNS